MKLGYQTILFAGQECNVPEMLDAIASAGGQGVEFFHPPSQLFGVGTDGSLGSPLNILLLSLELKKRNLTLLGFAGGSLKERVEYCLGYDEKERLALHLEPKELMPLYLYLEDWDDPDKVSAIEHGFKLALHPHFFMKIEKMSVVRKDPKYNQPEIYWLPDTAHLYLAGDDPVEEVTEMPADKLVAVHLKDWNEAVSRSYNGYAEGFSDLGMGDVPLKETLDALRKRDFKGWLVAEQDYPRRSIQASLRSARDWFIANEVLDTSYAKRDIVFQSGPARASITTLATLYTNSKLSDLDTTGKGNCYVPLTEAIKTQTKAALVAIWAWDSSRDVATLLASSQPVEALNHLTLVGLDGIMAETIRDRRESAWHAEKLTAGVENDRLRSLAMEAGASLIALLPVFQTHNPNHIRFVVCLLSKEVIRTEAASIQALINRVSDQTNQRRRTYFTGRVSFLAKRSPTLQDFIDVLQDFITKELPCEAASVFLENVSGEQLVPRTSNVVWRTGSSAEHFYERKDATKYPTAKCWVDGRTVFVQDIVSDTRSWKSKEEVPAGKDLTIGHQPGAERHDVLLVPIRVVLSGEESSYARYSVVGVIRVRNKQRRPNELYKPHFNDDDAASLTAICESAAAAIGPMLDFERQKMRLALMTHELKSPMNVLSAIIDQTSHSVGRLFETLAKNPQLRVHLADPILTKQVDKLYDYSEDAISWLHLMVRQVDQVRVLESRELGQILEIEQGYLMADVIAPMKPQFSYELRRRKLSVGGITYSDFGIIDKLYFDRNLMQQVFFNLISNAIKYAFQKRPADFSIHIEATEEGDYYRIDCEDFGAGIPDGYEELIFKEGVRAPGAVLSGEKGLGLGLWVVKKIVEAHGGKVAVRKNYNPTVISIYLPKSLKNMPSRKNFSQFA